MSHSDRRSVLLSNVSRGLLLGVPLMFAVSAAAPTAAVADKSETTEYQKKVVVQAVGEAEAEAD